MIPNSCTVSPGLKFFNEEERWVMINIWVALILKDMFKDKNKQMKPQEKKV